jgi:hypothetical protein
MPDRDLAARPFVGDRLVQMGDFSAGTATERLPKGVVSNMKPIARRLFPQSRTDTSHDTRAAALTPARKQSLHVRRSPVRLV